MSKEKSKNNSNASKRRGKTLILDRIQKSTGYTRSYISKVINGREQNDLIKSLYELLQKDFLKFWEATEKIYKR